MKHIKRVPADAFLALLVVTGACAALAGLYLLAGLAPTLIAGGLSAIIAGLMVDI